MINPRSRRIAAGVAAAALTLTAAGCTAGDERSTAPTAPPASPSATAGEPASSPGGVTQPFGPGCPNLPDNGDGSLVDLSQRDWLTALAQVPALSQLSVTTALAELGDDFSGLEEATVFAPTDVAFRTLGMARARELLTRPAEAADVVRYHVVPGRLTPDELPGTHPTLTGQTIEVTGSGEDYTVNGQAAIICGNLQTKNATIYLIDKLLQPS
jgi:uncharacterized surface protein with fasciclin (FAS1) repeats